METICEKVTSPENLLKGYNETLILYGQSGSVKTSTLMGERALESKETDEDDGIIDQFVKKLFRLMKDSSKEIVFIVKVSFLEIYLEQMSDLLQPSNGFLKFRMGDQSNKDDFNEIDGLSEVCCVNASDIISLVRKGHAHRTVKAIRRQTDMSRSNTVLKIKIEQMNLATKSTTKSTLHIVDTVGIEVDDSKGSSVQRSTPNSRQLEISLSDQSYSALEDIVSVLENDETAGRDIAEAFRGSTLTTVLSGALGGNSFCAFLLVASSASINIRSTLATLKFGQRLGRITNYPVANVQIPAMECHNELMQSKRIQAKFSRIIKLMGHEFDMIEENKLDELPMGEDVWKKIYAIYSKNKQFFREHDVDEDIDENGNHEKSSIREESELERDEISVLRKKVQDISTARDDAQKIGNELQRDCLFYRKESDDILRVKRKNTIDLIEAQNEIQSLNQRKLEVEQDLRISRFRENEAVAFLRHLRRFYRRLLENINARGSGDFEAAIKDVAGVPDLSELEDLDKLFLDSGLIEDYEVGEDFDAQDYQPSANALFRSSQQVEKVRSTRSVSSSNRVSAPVQQLENTRHAVNRSLSVASDGIQSSASQSSTGVRQQLENIRNAVNRSLLGTAGAIGTGQTMSTLTVSTVSQTSLFPGDSPDISYEDTGTNSGSSNPESLNTPSQATTPPMSLFIPTTPSARFTGEKVNELENEVLTMTKRCIQLQTSLSSAEDMVEALTAKRKNVKKLKNARQELSSKAEYEKKAADLEAVVWKMNELHLVNRTYNDKLVNRDSHIAWLEDSLRSAQEKNLQLVTLHIKNENKLRNEVERLNGVVDSLTTKFWQNGEAAIPMESRIIVPFQGSGVVTNRKVETQSRDESEVVDNEIKTKAKILTAHDVNNRSREMNDKTTRTPIVQKDQGADLAVICAGGKAKDFVPRRFTTKRGRLIKSATFKDSLPSPDTTNSQRSNADLATVRRQLTQLEALTKSWKRTRN